MAASLCSLWRRPILLASYQALSPRVTAIKKDCRTSIGSHFSLSLGRVRMVASLPFPVLSKEQIRLRMNLERCPLEIKLIILLQVIQNKIDMFQTWDDVSMLFYRKVFFSQVNHWFVFFSSWPISLMRYHSKNETVKSASGPITWLSKNPSSAKKYTGIW